MKSLILSLLALCLSLFPQGIEAVTNGEVAKENDTLVRVGPCNGVLIAPSFILTAAHCVYDTPANLVTLRRMDGSFIKEKKHIITHPDYESWNSQGIKRHDIALIELNTEIIANYPRIAMDHDSREAEISGWGKREDGSYPRNPHTISQLPLLPLYSDQFWDSHLSLLKSDDLNQDFEESFFSGDYLAIKVVAGQSACRGDSGAPVIGNYNELIGLVSHGQDDCEQQELFFITDVTQYAGWIHNVVGKSND